MSCGTDLGTAVAGDINDVRHVVLGGGPKTVPADLADPAVVVVGLVVAEAGGTADTLDAVVVDAATRTIAVDLGGTAGWLSSAAPGRYLIEYQVTFADGREWTWPSAAPDLLTVRAGNN